MKRGEYYGFVADVRRFRPLVTVVLTVLFASPSLVQMATQGLSDIAVLERLVEALAISSVLVWIIASVLLHYAKVQSRTATDDGESGHFQL